MEKKSGKLRLKKITESILYGSPYFPLFQDLHFSSIIPEVPQARLGLSPAKRISLIMLSQSDIPEVLDRSLSHECAPHLDLILFNMVTIYYVSLHQIIGLLTLRPARSVDSGCCGWNTHKAPTKVHTHCIYH